jgi:hypothetical protein
LYNFSKELAANPKVLNIAKGKGKQKRQTGKNRDKKGKGADEEGGCCEGCAIM